MMAEGKKHLIKEIAATGIASPLLILLLLLLHQQTVLFWLVFPFLGLTYRVGTWINSVFPPQGGGWFAGLGTLLAVEAVPALILIWLILFSVLKLIERLINRKKREE